MGKSFKSGERYGHIGMRSSKIPKQIQPKEIFIGCIVVKLSKKSRTQRKSWKQQDKKESSHVKESWYDYQQIYQQKSYRDWDWDPRREWDYISKILSWAGVGAGGTTIKNTLPSKAIMKKWRRDKDFPRPTKAEGICSHQTFPVRNPIRSLLSWNKNTQINNRKIWRRGNTSKHFMKPALPWWASLNGSVVKNLSAMWEM